MELRRPDPVERADDLDAEVAREAPALALEAAPVHHDRLWVVVVGGVRDEPDAVAAVLDARRRVRSRALAAVAVQHDELHLPAW